MIFSKIDTVENLGVGVDLVRWSASFSSSDGDNMVGEGFLFNTLAVQSFSLDDAEKTHLLLGCT